MRYTYLETPIGPFLVAGEDGALAMTSFSSGTQRRGPEPGWIEDASAVGAAVDQLGEYFHGQREVFELTLAIRGTDFQREVWRTLQAIPFGQTRSYGEIAATLGKPGASRAVGGANAANILPIVVPCHRVIGADETLTGFGGGIETKRWLLRHEGALPAEQRPLFR